MRDFMISSGLKVPIPAMATPAWTRLCQYRAVYGLAGEWDVSSIPSQYRRRRPWRRISLRRRCHQIQVSQPLDQLSRFHRHRGEKKDHEETKREG